MTPVVCPKCAIPMNRHAEKVVVPVDDTDAALVDPVLGGVVAEVHECPGCGATAARVAPPAHGATRSGRPAS
jgi:hypothetical protein